MEIVETFNNYVLIVFNEKRYFLPVGLCVAPSEDGQNILIGTTAQLYEMNTYVLAIPFTQISGNLDEAFKTMAAIFKGTIK